jgi:hypothetical protein
VRRVDFQRAIQLPWISGLAGQGALDAIRRGEKTVEVRFADARLFTPQGTRPLLRSLSAGDLFAFRERLQDGTGLVVLRVLCAPFATHPTRGHAVQVHTTAALPEALVGGFHSSHLAYSAEWADEYCDLTYGPASHEPTAVSVQFCLLGAAWKDSHEDDEPSLEEIAAYDLAEAGAPATAGPNTSAAPDALPAVSSVHTPSQARDVGSPTLATTTTAQEAAIKVTPSFDTSATLDARPPTNVLDAVASSDDQCTPLSAAQRARTRAWRLAAAAPVLTAELPTETPCRSLSPSVHPAASTHPVDVPTAVPRPTVPPIASLACGPVALASSGLAESLPSDCDAAPRPDINSGPTSCTAHGTRQPHASPLPTRLS